MKMILEKLIEKFETIDKYERFKLKHEISCIIKDLQKTPPTNKNEDNKILVRYSEIKTDEELDDLREAILKNFYLNSYFNENDATMTKTLLSKFELEAFFQLFQASVSGNEKEREDIIAQHIIFLHLSKSKTSKKGFFEKAFKTITTTKILVDDALYDFKTTKFHPKRFENIFTGLLVNSLFKSIINEVVLNITSKNNKFDISTSQLKFFVSDFDNLNGFAGINTIYINLKQRKNLFDLLDDDDDRLFISNLDFIRLCLHGLAYVAIRSTVGDLNESTANLIKEKNKDKMNLDNMEVGRIAEIMLLGESINWEKTINNKNFDLSHFKKIYDEIVKGEISVDDFLKFHDSTKVLTYDLHTFTYMGFDLIPDSPDPDLIFQ